MASLLPSGAGRGDGLHVVDEMLQKGVLNDGDGQSRDKPKRIKRIQFAMLSGAEMVQASEIRVSNKQLYDISTREPVPYGCLDPRLGVSDKSAKCQTCDQKLAQCTGHFGHIELALPVFHIGYYKAIQSVLQSICKSCGNALLAPPDKARFLAQMSRTNLDSIQKANVRKKLLEACKKTRRCPECQDLNGTVKKVQGADSLKLVHEKYKVKDFKDDDAYVAARVGAFRTAISAEASTELDEAGVRRIQEALNPRMVLDLFRKVRDADLPLLWSSAAFSRPENMVLTHILVPPIAIRPSAKVDTQGTNEDDLTGKLQEILDCNNELANLMAQGGKTKKIYDHWNWLQVRVSQFFNGELPGLSPQVRREQKVIRGLVQRLKGKQGRFRGNLSGKRVDFSGRTVISPDPNLSIHQVGVPTAMARKLTYPERVNEHNMARLRQAVINGPDVHPGANGVRSLDLPADAAGATPPRAASNANADSDGRLLRNLQYVRRRDLLAADLRVGDVVERHLRDDDVVLFNRQPSLHKMSIMSHRVKVLQGRTLRFNECVCAPYNADFDGDEMNLHVPQTEEARTEAALLMGVQNNLITPRNGEPLVTATQDFITSAFLMTQRDVFFTRERFAQVLATIGDANEHLDMPAPTILKPMRLWTGKQVWTTLLRPRPANPNAGERRVLVNLEAKERNFDSDAVGKGADACMCPNEGYVVFRNSELLCGSIGKGTLGGSKSGLFYVLIRDHASDEAARVMNRMTKVCTRWLSDHGFTMGLDDVTPSPELLLKKAEEIEQGEASCRRFISAFEAGTLQTRPGCNMEESLESEVSGVLSRVRDTAGKMCMQTLPRFNKPFVMATCGSKGSALNICQMMVCVGQQIVGGKRMPYGFVRRTLPHFKENAKGADARGFVKNSFFSGLTAPEFFFHTMGGREGLVDTAVKTAETGYMARRLMKALEDLSVHYDGSVRNAMNGVVQFTYGDDGLNPACMERGDRPVDWHRLENHVKPSHPCPDEPALTPSGIRGLLQAEFSTWPQVLHTTGAARDAGAASQFSEANAGVTFFLQEMQQAGARLADTLQRTATRIGLEDLDAFGAHFPLSRAADVLAHCEAQQRRQQRRKQPQQPQRQGPSAEDKLLCLNKVCRTTETQLRTMMGSAVRRFMRAMTEPGEAVGAIGAQSLGEPGTQMTLKTFHFAGVASMNVTLGVPRIKEIINASKAISTPIITVKLSHDDDERVARIVQGRIEATRLGDVASYVEERYGSDGCSVTVRLAQEAIHRLHLDVTAASVCRAVQQHKALRLRDASAAVRCEGSDSVVVQVDASHKLGAGRATATSTEHAGRDRVRAALRDDIPLVFNVQSMKRLLRGVVVNGIPSVQRAVVNRDEADDTKFELLVEGLGLQHVLGVPGVDGARTTTNHVMEMEEVLGIEAARDLVQREVAYIFGRYGLSIDKRHLMLLADVMSYRGSILGITRFGIAKMKESVLMLASFEKTADHLFDAAVHGRRDDISGVSECIIMGTPIPLGTGMFKLVGAWEDAARPVPQLRVRERTLLDF